MRDDVITIALAKGRLADKTMDLLEAIGVDCSQARDPGRKLVLEDKTGAYRFILVKPSDVPTYVEHGVADVGVAGKDILQIFVNGNEEQLMLSARLDNLGKGASGAAIQNMNIMLGFEEIKGLNL